jgi:hypothetical protein
VPERGQAFLRINSFNESCRRACFTAADGALLFVTFVSYPRWGVLAHDLIAVDERRQALPKSRPPLAARRKPGCCTPLRPEH